MKKTITKIFVAVLALAFCVSSCTKKSENLNSIPKNAFVVVTIDGEAWLKNSNSDLLMENDDFKEGLKELEETSKKLKELVEKIIKKPAESGINIDEMMYAFAEMDKENVIVGVILGVDNKKLEENIKLVTDELQVPLETKEKDGITYIMPDDDMIVGWDKGKMIVLTLAEGYDYDLEKKFFALMSQKKSESILEDKDFNQFLKNCKDFNVWISSNVVKNIEDSESIAFAEKMVGFEFSGNYAHIHFDAEKDEWTMTAKLRFNESIQKADWNKIIKNLSEMGLMEEIMGEIFGGGYDYDDYDDYEYDWDSTGGEYDLTDEEWAEIEKLLSEEE